MVNQGARVEESVEFVRSQTKKKPVVGVVLGSGLGDYAGSLKNSLSLDTASIPHYPRSSVEGHKGRLVFGNVGKKVVLAFQGRIHLYESNDADVVLYPIRVAIALGVRSLIITNAAGGVSRRFAPGTLMVMTDHINLTGESLDLEASSRKNPVYDPVFIQTARRVAMQEQIKTAVGIYASVKGPSYETAAEVEMIHRIGGDAVGMSTVLEASLASNLGMRVLGISCITNLGTGLSKKKLDHSEVTEVAARVKQDFSRLLTAIISSL